MDDATRTGRVLSEDEVRLISRSVRKYIPSVAATGNSSTEDQLKAIQILFDNVFLTSSKTNLKASHRVAAWNTLCSLIDRSLESDMAGLEIFIWEGGWWRRAFDLYLSHAQSARPKSSRQLLVTLTNALRKGPERYTAKSKATATHNLLQCLVEYEQPHAAKVSAQLLGYLLTKAVITLEEVLQVFGELQTSRDSTKNYSTHKRASIESLLGALLRWLSVGDFGSTVSQLASTILDTAGNTHSHSGQPVWIKPLQVAWGYGHIDLDSARVHLLPSLFKRNFDDYVLFLKELGLDSLRSRPSAAVSLPSGNDEDLLFASLQTAKEIGLLIETEGPSIDYRSPTVLIPLSVIGGLLTRSSRSARVTGLSLLITSHSATRPFPRTALKLFKRALEVMFADVDADCRSDVFSAVQRFIDRMRAITAVLARHAGATHRTDLNALKDDGWSSEQLLKYHQDLLVWLIRFLARELRPTASYQRHISSLKCLVVLAKSGLDQSVPSKHLSKSAHGDTRWPAHMPVVTVSMRRLLLDRVLDPFDDVRQIASNVLDICCLGEVKGTGQGTQLNLRIAIERSEARMLSSGRADQADGVAQLYALCVRGSAREEQNSSAFWSSKQAMVHHLMESVRRMIGVAKDSLTEAVQNYPLHGLLTSLRYALSQTSASLPGSDLRSVFEHLGEVWRVVKPILCNDAPEGFRPDELEEAGESSKEVLSYCWRALKEASLLLSQLVTSQTSQEDLSHSVLLQQMSDLCFTQLAELRHRGAFSTVAQTWATCCMRCKGMKNPAGIPVLQQWYNQVILMLRNNVTINTRRSAGLPSLLCGILIADESGKIFAQAFNELEEIARQAIDPAFDEEGSLPQVHAMNCLKDVLKNSKLGEQSEVYVPITLRLAAHALQSDVWAIRNCGLMLFRAVIDRLLGTDQAHFEEDSKLQTYISSEEYPKLLDIILALLPQSNTVDGTYQTRYEGMFPALQLLQHTKIPASRLDEAVNAVQSLTASPSWHVRDKAARTLASLLAHNNHMESVKTTFAGFTTTHYTTNNAFHGSMLTLRYFFKTMRSVFEQQGAYKRTHHRTGLSETWRDLCLNFLEIHFQHCTTASPCFITQAARIDAVRECFGVLSCIEEPGELTQTQCRLMNASPVYRDGIDSHKDNARDHITFYQNLLSPSLSDPAAAMLRQSVVRFIAQQLVYVDIADRYDVASYVTMVKNVARVDESACKYLLSALDLDKLSRHVSNKQFLLELTGQFLQEDFGVELKCDAQRTLIDLLSIDSESSGSTIVETKTLGPCLGSDKSNQRYADQHLQLQGLLLERNILSTQRPTTASSHRIASWASDCVRAVRGTGLCRLEAAAEALSQLRNIWQVFSSHDELSSPYREVCIAVYDLLNDDDEDIRLMASNITQRILSAGDQRQHESHEPIIASQKLLAYCLRRWNTSPEMALIAFQRAFGISGDAAPIAVSQQLERLSIRDTSLFAEEKQNLYIDDAREVRVWSQAIQRLSPTELPPKLVVQLTHWVGDGLDTLSKKAGENLDGPLGWSSSEEVFTLGLRVISGAEVLLALVKRGIRLVIRPSQLRRRLFECEVAFQSSEVNCLWLWEMERILADSVLHKMGLVKHLLKAVEPQM